MNLFSKCIYCPMKSMWKCLFHCILTNTRPYSSLSSLLFWWVTNGYHFSFLKLHFWNVSGVEHFFIYLTIFSFLMDLPTNDTQFFSIGIFILLIYKNFVYIKKTFYLHFIDTSLNLSSHFNLLTMFLDKHKFCIFI